VNRGVFSFQVGDCLNELANAKFSILYFRVFVASIQDHRSWEGDEKVSPIWDPRHSPSWMQYLGYLDQRFIQYLGLSRELWITHSRINANAAFLLHENTLLSLWTLVGRTIYQRWWSQLLVRALPSRSSYSKTR